MIILILGPRNILIFTVGVECGENRGRTGGAQKNWGRTRGIWERTGGEPGAFGIHLQRVPGEKRGLWDKNQGEPEFPLKQETQLGT